MLNKQELQRKVIKLFQENPIVQIACHKAGVSRSTFYRWRQEDGEFKKACTKALTIGLDLANDAVESVLLKKAREGDMKAIPYWLNTNSKKYKNNYKGYNEQHFLILQELNKEKKKYDALLEEEKTALIEILDIVKKTPPYEKSNIISGEYYDDSASR